RAAPPRQPADVSRRPEAQGHAHHGSGSGVPAVRRAAQPQARPARRSPSARCRRRRGLASRRRSGADYHRRPRRIETPGRTRSTVRAGAAAALLLAFACEAHAQDAREHIEPDQPDVTNGTHIVSGGLTQIEFGGIYSHDAAAQKTASMPFTIRIGVADWLEARVGADGVLTQQNGATRETGFGNVQLGAKLRLWADPGGVPVFSVLPTINLPMASAANGLGSGDVDLTLALLTGTDIGSHGRVDFNYGIGSIGGGAGRGRFVQHLLSTSISAAAGPRWNPYVEVFWFSRTEID